VGVEIFAPNYQKAHPYPKSGRTKSFGVCGSNVVLTLYVKASKRVGNRERVTDAC